MVSVCACGSLFTLPFLSLILCRFVDVVCHFVSNFVPFRLLKILPFFFFFCLGYFLCRIVIGAVSSLSSAGHHNGEPSARSCLFCCWPIGLVAIFQASHVRKRYEHNDFEVSMPANSNHYIARAVLSNSILVRAHVSCLLPFFCSLCACVCVCVFMF